MPVVSVGSTPTITTVDHLEGIDEARPGNYIFFDAFMATAGTCSFEDRALTVLAAVVHRDLRRGQGGNGCRCACPLERSRTRRI